ncbi:Na+/H+ antiporter subunit E [Leifsonia sp. H3M29-4]|uniref:Na+/H+ antiporter subunit E n=1 Tax=Salinibacterium metalliresistens TaxID=3031321 RepID=UPI0023D9BB88|nr:Na+/H+ antiporter subunit E [Salinibacterium metalliresistens]MDF1479243.1 Na+/H+ antiporter subunit E [Salinibacterium metalliresistens]
MTAPPRTRREIGWRIWQQVPLILGLVVLWMLLWGEFSWLALASGVLVAVLVTRAFYLPAVELSGRFNPFWFLVFLGRFGFDLAVASFQVAWIAVRPRPPGRNAVIAVDLVTRTDFMTTAVALAISLVPGSVVVDVDREASILYLHVLGVDDQTQVTAVRERVLGVERALVRALGSADDVRRVKAWTS